MSASAVFILDLKGKVSVTPGSSSQVGQSSLHPPGEVSQITPPSLYPLQYFRSPDPSFWVLPGSIHTVYPYPPLHFSAWRRGS